MHRREFLLAGVAFAGAATGAAFLFGPRTGAAAAESFPVTLSEEAWRAKLSPEQFAVLREQATERPFSSPLDAVKEAGTFSCAGCDNPVYSSAAKFDSGTGWPSFWESIEGSVGTDTDYLLIYPRTEVHCARCGGHLGHIFDDGPPPTGKRHCINGVAMTFAAEGAPASG